MQISGKNIQMKLSLTEHFNQEWQGSILLNILATVTLIFIFVWHFNTLYCKDWTTYDIERDNNFLQKKRGRKDKKQRKKWNLGTTFLRICGAKSYHCYLNRGPGLLAIRDWRRARARHVEHFRKQRTAKEKQFQVTCEQTTLSSTSLSNGWWKWPRKVWWPATCTQGLWRHVLPLGGKRKLYMWKLVSFFIYFMQHLVVRLTDRVEPSLTNIYLLNAVIVIILTNVLPWPMCHFLVAIFFPSVDHFL